MQVGESIFQSLLTKSSIMSEDSFTPPETQDDPRSPRNRGAAATESRMDERVRMNLPSHNRPMPPIPAILLSDPGHGRDDPSSLQVPSIHPPRTVLIPLYQGQNPNNRHAILHTFILQNAILGTGYSAPPIINGRVDHSLISAEIRAAMMAELGTGRRNPPATDNALHASDNVIPVRRRRFGDSIFSPPRPPPTPVFPKWKASPPETCPAPLRVGGRPDGALLTITLENASTWFEQDPYFFHVTFMRHQPSLDGAWFTYWLFDCFEKVKAYKGEYFARQRLQVVFDKLGMKENNAWEGWTGGAEAPANETGPSAVDSMSTDSNARKSNWWSPWR